VNAALRGNVRSDRCAHGASDRLCLRESEVARDREGGRRWRVDTPVKASDRFVPKCTDFRRSPCDLAPKGMHSKESPIQRGPCLFARIIVVRTDLFDHDLALDAHVFW
jgi:hypothetical protein